MQVESSTVALGLKFEAVESVQPYIIQKEHNSQQTVKGVSVFKLIVLNVSEKIIPTHPSWCLLAQKMIHCAKQMATQDDTAQTDS